MIVTRTPLRVSFVGGGTDLPGFYRQHGGAVVSMAIRRYVNITVNPLWPQGDHRIRLVYSRTEQVDSAEQVQHPIVRAALQLLNIDRPVEIHSLADVPAGTGLGSSSSFTVGLLHALHAFEGRRPHWRQLAEEACHIELDMLGEPIGKQDQYAAAAGGLRHLQFRPDDSVVSQPLDLSPQRQAAFLSHLLAFWVQGQRQASSVLEGLNQDLDQQQHRLLRIADLRATFLEQLRDEHSDIRQLGPLLHRAWTTKRALSAAISTPRIDALYARAQAAGATGGKLLGAGGGGFLLLFAPPGHHRQIRDAMGQRYELPLELATEGSALVFQDP